MPAAQAVVKIALTQGAERHPVLIELRRDVFRGGTVWVLWEDETFLSLNCSRIGKRKKNIWEPFLNWYTAYTTPTERRKGYATELYTHAEREALNAGCRRVKSLAGSSAGLALHLSLGHQCWGLTEGNEVWVDSPLPGHEDLYKGLVPPQAPEQRPMLRPFVKHFIKEGLRYDHGT